MKINFYLPRVYRKISGGYKVIYQYSNYLASKGHDVYIYYNMNNGKNSKHIPKIIGQLIWKLLFIGFPSWFSFNKNVTQILAKQYDNKYIRNADVSIATTPHVAYFISKLSKSKGEKFYFIQGYENWGKTTDEFVQKSYDLGMNNIVISKWLKNIVDKNSKRKSKLIANGINLDIFKISKEIEKRNSYSISMLYSDGEIKGCNYGLEVLKKLKNKYQNLKVTFYGSCVRPRFLPKWINYIKNASENQVVKILNDSAIFMCTSIEEGFGLPGLEAMACGCTLVTTNCHGIMEYANENNAMISEPKDVQAMYRNIDKLLTDNEFRIKLAKKGNSEIQNRSLKVSENEFENYITSKKEQQ